MTSLIVAKLGMSVFEGQFDIALSLISQCWLNGQVEFSLSLSLSI